MTFKGIFERLNFKENISGDFCVVVSRDDTQYAVFKNLGVQCISLHTFQMETIDSLSYFYDLPNEEDKEEYQFTYSIDKEHLINFLFGLIPVEPEEMMGFPTGFSYFDDLRIKKEGWKMALIMKDKKGNIKNVLAFDESSYRLLFSNRNCCWFRDQGQKSCLIGYNPYKFAERVTGEEGKEYAGFIMPLKSNYENLRLPFEYNFQSYEILCGDQDECREALRTVCEFLSLKKEMKINLSFLSGFGSIEFVLGEDDEVLPYIQMAANMLRELRKGFPEIGDMRTDAFRIQKNHGLSSKILEISFLQNVTELNILLNQLISTFVLPFKITVL